jgi:hypothetical protein
MVLNFNSLTLQENEVYLIFSDSNEFSGWNLKSIADLVGYADEKPKDPKDEKDKKEDKGVQFSSSDDGNEKLRIFFMTHLFVFEYIVYPKYLLRNSSLFNLDTSKFNFSLLENYSFNKKKNDKFILHSFIIGFTVNITNIGMKEVIKFYRNIDHYMHFFQPDNPADTYSQDLAYFVGLLASKLLFSDTQELDNQSI